MSERTPLIGVSPKMFSVFALVATCVVTCSLTIYMMNERGYIHDNYAIMSTSATKKGKSWGDRDTTLKLAKHITFHGLIGEAQGLNEFEASGVRIDGDYYYVIFDNLFEIGKIHKDLPFLSTDNYLLDLNGHTQNTTKRGDSEYEGIAVDQETNTFYLAQETVESKKDRFQANISEVRMGNSDYTVSRSCLTEQEFESQNKGIEGIAHLRVNNNEYLLGLCEGNHCQGGKKGRELGNGRVIVMNREIYNGKTTDSPNKSVVTDNRDKSPNKAEVTDKQASSGHCLWKTLQVLNIPKEARFQDYSDIAIHPGPKVGVWHVAILSQENSQIWLGKLHIPQEKQNTTKSHHLDWKLTTVAVYDFPRDDEGKVIYCNVEGVDFFTDDLIVVVSDRMKGEGKQPIWCLDRDQSIHIFSLP